MTTPNAYFVGPDGFPLKSGISIQPGGAIQFLIIDPATGQQVITLPGGGQGTVQSVNSVTPDNTGNVFLKAYNVAADAQAIPWNLDTNLATNPDNTTFIPTSGVFPVSGSNQLIASGSTPRTLDGNTFANGDLAEMSVALGQWVRIPATGVTRVSQLTAGSAWTGSTSESATQVTLNLLSGTIVAGTKIEIDMAVTMSGGGTTTVKSYFNGQGTAIPSAGLTDAASTGAAWWRAEILVLSATSFAMRAEFDTNSTASTKFIANNALNVTTGTGLSVGFTFTNSTTGQSATMVWADARIYPA